MRMTMVLSGRSCRIHAAMACVGLVALLAGEWPGHAQLASGTNGIAATGHPLATQAALDAMRRGGNAVDAAVAAGLTLGVVDGHNSGLGGGCFLLIRALRGGVVAVDGRETAPAAATRDMFVRGGKADPKLSQTGALSAGVPGALAAYEYATRLYGKRPLKEHLLAAAEIAENGFHLDATYARRLADHASQFKSFDATRAIFLRTDGSALQAGDLLRQPDLAATYRNIAHSGLDWFYKGPFAQATEIWMKSNGGVMTGADFQAYEPRRRSTLYTHYRGHQIVGFPPPSSGGVHIAQMLHILEGFDLRGMRANSAEFIHVVAEAMKLAFADRAAWLGDPDFAQVPRGLISREYGQQLAKKIHTEKVTAVPRANTPPSAKEDVFRRHTTHFSTADSEGNWVACTATINTSFGSKAVVPGTGVLLNNQMDDFVAQAGVPNAFGLLGAEANMVAPGKRPLSSMSPTIVLFNGRPVLSVGAAGGPTIISQVLLTILYMIDFNMPLEAALAQPRFHHQWSPDELRIERSAGAEVVRELQQRGHKVVVVDSLGATQAIAADVRTGAMTGRADPRGEGRAAGF